MMKHTAMWTLVFCLVTIGVSLFDVQTVKAGTNTSHDECRAFIKEIEVTDYRSGDEFTAPKETGYIFSGWYKEEACENPLEEDIKDGTAWARFVPEEILSVKAQISANLLDSEEANNDKAAIRFVTTVDSLQYREIGFDLTVNGITTRRSSTQVYKRLYAVGKKDGVVIEYTPQKDFCALSTYFKAWTFTNVPETAYETGITAQPFWITLDGTTVYGEKAVRTVRDGIKEYFDKTPDTEWFDPYVDEYIIGTPQELYGFKSLCNEQNNYFKGKIVKLGADIALNVGNAERWEDNPPENSWTPVTFSGTFDGQGHTISGVYAKTGSIYTGLFHTVNKGATVKNLKLTNSYFEGTKDPNDTSLNGGRAPVGSIAGRNYGTIDTVYSEAIVKNSALMTGGIVGMVYDSEESLIINCWFNGQIQAIGSSGGILGGTYGTATVKTTATIEHCLNTGVLKIRGTETGSTGIGGLCGYIQNVSTLNLRDSLNAGIYRKAEGIVSQVGAIVGALHNSGTLKVSSVYGVSEFSGKLIGWSDEGTFEQEENTASTLLTVEECYGRGVAGLSFYEGNETGDNEDMKTSWWLPRTENIPILASWRKEITVRDYYRRGWLLEEIPAYQGKNTLSTALYKCGTYLTEYEKEDASGNSMQGIWSTTEEELLGYAEDMKENGYKEERHTSIENNQFYRFVKGKKRVYVNYYGNAGRVTVELDESGRPSPAEVSYTYKPKAGEQTEFYLFGLKMDPYGYSLKQDKNTSGYVDNGACLVVKCADNSIIVIDGGVSAQMEKEDRDRFWNFLHEITGKEKDEVITVAAWYITHFDSDHTGGYSAVLEANPERYNLERVFCNLPDLVVASKGNDAGTVMPKNAIMNHYPDCQDVKLRTGDILQIADVTINTLYTHEDFADDAGRFNTTNFNNTSTVLMLTAGSGMKMLVTGDLMSKAESVLCRNFSAETLKCDIFQQPHHNRTDISTIYEYANAQVMLFTQAEGTLTENPTDLANSTLAKKWSSEWYCGGSETVGFNWLDGKANLIYQKRDIYE